MIYGFIVILLLNIYIFHCVTKFAQIEQFWQNNNTECQWLKTYILIYNVHEWKGEWILKSSNIIGFLDFFFRLFWLKIFTSWQLGTQGSMYSRNISFFFFGVNHNPHWLRPWFWTIACPTDWINSIPGLAELTWWCVLPQPMSFHLGLTQMSM